MKVTKLQLLEALRKHKGIFGEVATSLGISRQAVSKRVRADPKLSEIAESYREELLDIAERSLWKQVEEGSVKATIFVLSTLGRSRGYGKTLEIEDNSEKGTVFIVPPTMTIEEAQAQQGKVEGVSVWLPDNGRGAQGGTEGKEPKEPKVQFWFPDDERS